MALLSTLYLEVFVLITCFGLWHKNVSGILEKRTVYRALCIATITVSPISVLFLVHYHSTILSSKASATMDNYGAVSYLLLSFIYFLFKGWYSIRREKKGMMFVFLGINFVITVGWAVLFYSDIYRWSAFPAYGRNFYLNSFNRSFEQWPYLACYTVASFALLIASLILGIICRMNFGKGLAQYCELRNRSHFVLYPRLTILNLVHAESTLASLNFAPGLFSHDVTTPTITPPICKTDEHSLKEPHMKIPDLEDQPFQLNSKVYFITSLPTEVSDGSPESPHFQKYDDRF